MPKAANPLEETERLVVEKTPRKTRPITLFRYVNPEHHDLIRKCAEYAGLSVNDWLCLVTLKVARQEAAKAARLDAMREAATQI